MAKILGASKVTVRYQVTIPEYPHVILRTNRAKNVSLSEINNCEIQILILNNRI